MEQNKKRKLPFRCTVGTRNEFIINPYSGEGALLKPDAVAVYDTIKGCEVMQRWDLVNKGLDWFRKHEPTAYLKLLD